MEHKSKKNELTQLKLNAEEHYELLKSVAPTSQKEVHKKNFAKTYREFSYIVSGLGNITGKPYTASYQTGLSINESGLFKKDITCEHGGMCSFYKNVLAEIDGELKKVSVSF